MLWAVCCLLVAMAVIPPAVRAAEPLIVAHRGASAEAPENTLAAFRLAWQQGADGIEGDFRLTRDGRIVCIHDEDTKRVAGIEKKISEVTLAELQALDVGQWKGDPWRGEKVPTLEDVLAIVPDGKMLFIELKSGPEIVGPLAEIIRRANVPANQIVIICFNEEVISRCKRELPQVKRHLLVDYRQEGDRWTPAADEVAGRVRRSGADGLGTQNKLAHFDRHFVERLQVGGVDEFHVWTVDAPAEVRAYRELGAWAITTNRPAETRAALATR